MIRISYTSTDLSKFLEAIAVAGYLFFGRPAATFQRILFNVEGERYAFVKIEDDDTYKFVFIRLRLPFVDLC